VINRSFQKLVELSQIILAQAIEIPFYASVFGELLFAWNVLFVGRAARTLCGSHRDTLALPDSQG